MPPGPNPFQQVGAKPSHDTAGAPLFYNRFFGGLVTQRNPLRDPSGVVQERWYGGKGDSFIDGLNVEISNRLTPVRAPGTTAWPGNGGSGLGAGPNSFYAFKQFNGTNQPNETISLICDTVNLPGSPGEIFAINPTNKSTILNKSFGSGPAFFLGVNNVLYFGDGAEQQAWTPIGGVHNWGISASTGTFGGLGTVGANGGGSGTAWTNPGTAPSLSLAAGATSQWLRITGMGFVPQAGNIVGILVKLLLTTLSTTAGIPTVQVRAQLLNNGHPVGAIRQIQIAFGSSTTYSFGSSSVANTDPASDLWGFSWTSAITANMGVQIQVVSLNQGTTTFSLFSPNNVTAVIGYAAAPVPSLTTGSLSPTTGYKYVTAYGNSQSGALSPATPISALITPVAQGVQLTPAASVDPQVDQIWIFRTLDGGSQFYNLPNSPVPNASAGFTDNNADSVVQLSQQFPDLTGLNTPPPFGAIAPVYHMGKIWVAVGNVVYYSAGSDLGFIAGNGNEAFPPANFFSFPSQVIRMVSVSVGTSLQFLLVFTNSDVYPIYGNASAIGVGTGVAGLTQFYVGPVLLAKTGLRSYWELDVRGTTVYMFTSDGRLISFNASSQVVFLDPEKAVNEIGFPIGASPPGITLIGGSLANFTPGQCNVTWHGAGSADQALYVSNGSTGWFRCNTNQQPDGGATWSPFRKLAIGSLGTFHVTAVQSVETSPGVFQLLIGVFSATNSNGYIFYRDPTVFADNGAGYDAFGRVGAWTMAQHGQKAVVDFIGADFVATGSQPTIGVLMNELDGSFTTLQKTDNDPPHLTAPSTIYANRYSLRQSTSGSQAPNVGRYMQIKFDFGNDTVQNELLALAGFGTYEPEASM